MNELHIDDRVRLRQDLPYLSLHRGTVGVVRSLWFSQTAYEVEFEEVGLSDRTRALLVKDQLERDDSDAVIAAHDGDPA